MWRPPRVLLLIGNTRWRPGGVQVLKEIWLSHLAQQTWTKPAVVGGCFSLELRLVYCSLWDLSPTRRSNYARVRSLVSISVAEVDGDRQAEWLFTRCQLGDVARSLASRWHSRITSGALKGRFESDGDPVRSRWPQLERWRTWNDLLRRRIRIKPRTIRHSQRAFDTSTQTFCNVKRRR